MIDVAVLGAGDLGGTIASIVASLDIARTVHLVDDAGAIAAGKALDIAQSGPVLGFSTRVSGGTDVTAAAGAAVVVLADRALQGEWSTDDGRRVLERLGSGVSRSVIVCAGHTHRELVETGVRAIGWPRARLIGTAPEALAGALRAMAALEVSGSPQDVALTVLGVPPNHVVVPWDDASIRGMAATRVLDGPALRRLAALPPRLWPPGPIALASAAALALRALLGRSRQSVSAFVGPDDSQGCRTRAAALPVTLDRHGIARIELPALTPRDRVELDSAMLL